VGLRRGELALQLRERLCSLVPRPRTNQVLYRGVLAANSARRDAVVPELLDYARPKNATFCELMLSLRFAD